MYDHTKVQVTSIYCEQTALTYHASETYTILSTSETDMVYSYTWETVPGSLMLLSKLLCYKLSCQCHAHAPIATTLPLLCNFVLFSSKNTVYLNQTQVISASCCLLQDNIKVTLYSVVVG